MICLVIDEGVDKQIADRLISEGFCSFYIAHEMPGASDVKVLELANEKKAVLVTVDKDFGELVFRRNLINNGVSLIRLEGKRPLEKASIVASFLLEHQDEVANAFSVISENGVRIKKSNLIKF